MLELGGQARRWHERVGAYAAKAGVDLIVAVGSLAASLAEAARGAGTSIETLVYEDAEQASADLEEWVRPGDVVLVKGSLGSRMGLLVKALEGLTHALPRAANGE